MNAHATSIIQHSIVAVTKPVDWMLQEMVTGVKEQISKVL